jgi:hypothetical protein
MDVLSVADLSGFASARLLWLRQLQHHIQQGSHSPAYLRMQIR